MEKAARAVAKRPDGKRGDAQPVQEDVKPKEKPFGVSVLAAFQVAVKGDE
tara:strand:+ start:1997 stop:2146 length:150 start_codon:yes stop_codon:yes gene_type:complete